MVDQIVATILEALENVDDGVKVGQSDDGHEIC
jgi:hypothetical protein